jgi:hypothetical protein
MELRKDGAATTKIRSVGDSGTIGKKDPPLRRRNRRTRRLKNEGRLIMQIEFSDATKSGFG